MHTSLTVVKIGGSLLDLSDLGTRLDRWLHRRGDARILLTVGGGRTTDAVRYADQIHRLSPETAHWLAIRALTVNTHLLAALLPRAVVVQNLEDCASYWQSHLVPVLDPFPFLLGDERRPDRLPHRWDVTSDSIAARIAIRFAAAELILLKSRPQPCASWQDAADAGYVDAYFPTLTPLLPRVSACDLRAIE